MHLLIQGLFLLIIFDNFVLGLISLHNGRIVNKHGVNETSSTLQGGSSSGFMMRGKRRDASVFRLKFLDGTDADAFEFVDAGSGWGAGGSAVDQSPTSGPLDYVDPLGDDYDENRGENSEHFLSVAPTKHQEIPTVTPSLDLNQATFSTKSNDSLLNETYSTPSHQRTTPIISLDDEDGIFENPSATDDKDTEEGSEWPHFEDEDDDENFTHSLATLSTLPTILSSLSIDEPPSSTNKPTRPTFAPVMCNDTLLGEPSSTTPQTTTFSSTLALTTTINPCIPVNQSEISSETTPTPSSFAPTLETVKEQFNSTVSPNFNVTTDFALPNDTTTAFFSTKSEYNLTTTPSIISVNNTGDTTIIYDETNSAEIVDSLGNLTSTVTPPEMSNFTTTSDYADGSGTIVTSSEQSITIVETTAVMMSNVTVNNETSDSNVTTLAPDIGDVGTTPFTGNTSILTSPSYTETTVISTSQMLTETTTITATSTLEDDKNSSTTQSIVNNATVIPFGNLNVAKVRMSIYVTTAFTRRELEKLLQHGLQNAFISALNRNTKMDDILAEVKRIIRMTNPLIEIFAIAIPPKSEEQSSVMHINVTFGAILPSSHGTNRTGKSHLTKRTLPGHHVRNIMLSVTPIELSAAAGIPIEAIRSVNEHDYDIITDTLYNSSAEAEREEVGKPPEDKQVEAGPRQKMPEWILPVVIVIAALVLVITYVVTTGVCVLKGYRLRLEKVGTTSSPDGSYAEGAARLAEVVASPPDRHHMLTSNFAVQPLAPISKMFVAAESHSPTVATKPQLELRRWTIDGHDEQMMNRLQHQALSLDVSSQSSDAKKQMPSKIVTSAPAKEVTCDKSINTSTVALHSMATATEGPEYVNRATSAVHQQSRTVGTSLAQFQTDQSTDTTADIGPKMKSVQTTTITSCFNSVKESTMTPDIAASMGAIVNGEQMAQAENPTPIQQSLKDQSKRRSRRRRDRYNEHADTASGNESGKVHNTARRTVSKEGMANNNQVSAGSASGILLHPLELRYDTIYLRQNEKPDSKQVDSPFKLVKLIPGVDVKEQLVQTVKPVSLEDAKKIDEEMKESRKRNGARNNGKEKMIDKKEGEQLKTLLDTVEGIVRKYTARNEPEDNKLRADANNCIQQTMQRDLSYIKSRPRVGRNMRAVSPEGSPKAPPMLASFEAALRLRVADETISEERVRRQYQIPFVQNSTGSASILARHLLERGKIGPEI